MGCWSESCAISGMEIRPGDKIYVAIVAPCEYSSKSELTIPPILGEYDDYGGMENGEAAPLWKIDPGMEWRPRSERRGWPVYMKAEVFDFLETLPTERKSEVSIGNIADDKLVKIREILAQIRPLEPTDNERWRLKYALENEIDRSSEYIAGRHYLANALIDSTESEKEELLKLLRRAYVFIIGQRELRKRFSPRIDGPQHGGGKALIAFYDFVADLAKKRLALDIEEFGGD